MIEMEEIRLNFLVVFGEMLLSWKMVIKILMIISFVIGVFVLFIWVKIGGNSLLSVVVFVV